MHYNYLEVVKITKVWFDKDNIYVVTNSGHTIGNPINWFARLNGASQAQRENFEIGPTGESIHWEELDEDLSLESLFDFDRKLHYAKI